jgi:hypothetical protein
MAASQILKGTNALLEQVFSAGDATGNVTVTVTRADGTTLSTGTATHGTVGQYTYVVAPQTELDYLTVTWSGTWGGVVNTITSYAEIVGGVLFPLSDLRSFGDQVLSDTVKYTDETLRESREQITDDFEDICQCSFIPRYGRDVLDGTGNCRIWLTHKRVRRIISASVDGVALSDLTILKPYPTGRLERTNGTWGSGVLNSQNVVVAYEYGWPSPPAGISRAAKTLARYELVSSDISDRMVSFSNDLGEVRLSVPGNKYPTGIPIVDATLSRYDETDLLPPW